ncbi:glycoside hydrolase family 5 protein [Aaosphaeria arxii CBS 175.79]|uniref:Glycoside hydrolase family 5 protein n=1 Tax=Aaosphaeria arxii CBS 175.79 TaxID=1450172 RepID=A0A6A5YA03_9PLEO|nr:glycoside hydrolase family 5 protein [Aaosphaeria arxii CBS 175.79]KAF2022169.1 glycoside hydrolase family 5 protein [Aaosphaeria arxii CBS 175.79]
MVSDSWKAAFLAASATLLQSAVAQNVTCNGSFSPISASNFVSKMNPGWNLGNTLDAVQKEGDWNNPPVVATTFDDIKSAGFKGVRLPVTWAYHFTSEAPDYTVDPVWLQRVSDVIDMITSRGFYAIVNVHHDSWTWMDLTKETDYAKIEDKFYKLWYQIGTKLACKGSQVAFEPINEIPGTTAEHGAEVNKLNNIFLKAINDAGGFNPQRVVTLVGSGEDGPKTSQWFVKPDAKFKNPWAIQYHYYSPYDFIFSAWGKTTWGSDADKASLEADIAAVRGNFTDIPLIIGEWAASPVATETAARWRYFDFFIRTAAKYNTATVLWDNGADFLNRATHQWRDQVALDILRTAAAGKTNSLPDSTTDGSTTQNSSAYVYHKLNETVTDVELPFHFNGNSFSSAKLAGKNLAKGKDYSVSGEKITFKKSFLSTILTSSSRTGSLANVTLNFSAGASLQVNILQWSVPTLGVTSSKVPASSTDLLIPITWAGQNRPAAVRAVKNDGTYLSDDWTQYLPDLQKARITYNGQWNWDGQNVVLPAAVVDLVRQGGKDTTFTIEFYPRVPGNVVNYTLTV